jgi:hypothetical protein
MNRLLPLLALSFCMAVAACAARPAPPDLRPGQKIAVLPANNRTGDPLLVSGASLIDRYALHAERVTVGEVLAAEVRYQLAERGVAVIAGDKITAATQGRVPQDSSAAADIATRGKLDALVLYLEIRRWEPDAPVHTAFVIVGVSASLLDPASGKVVWQFDRHPAPIATPGEVTLENAYETAARKAATEIVTSFRP